VATERGALALRPRQHCLCPGFLAAQLLQAR